MLRVLDSIGAVLIAVMILGPMAMSPANDDPQAQATTPENTTNGRPAQSTAITPNPPDASNAASPAGALIPSPTDESTSPEQSGASSSTGTGR